MSQFMPEGREQQASPKTPEQGPEAYLSAEERRFWQRYTSFPEELSPKFRSWVLDHIAVNIPQIPVSALVGFNNFAGQVAVSVSRSSAQSIPTATWTTMNWDTELFDSHDFHSTTTNTNRLTVPVGKSGQYLIGCSISCFPNATGIRGMQITKNTTTANTNVQDEDSKNGIAGISNHLSVTVPVVLQGGDWLSVNVYQDSGAALDFPQANYFVPSFWAVRMAV